MKHNYFFIFAFCFGLLTTAGAQSFLNPSFESWGSSTACEVNTAPDNWMEYSNGGIGVDEANFSYCATTIPPAPADGNIYARSYGASANTGEGFYQLVNGFMIGNMYMITYNYSGSNLYGGNDSLRWHIFIDDVDVDSTVFFQSTDPVWTSHGYTFMATATTHKIGFRTYSAGNGAASGGIDHVDLSQTTGFTALQGIKGISVYPSVAAEILTIDLNKVEGVKILVFNGLGQQVLIDPVGNGDKMTIDISSLEKGIYFVRISTEKEVVVKRFVKE
jgi:hypothetical protein